MKWNLHKVLVPYSSKNLEKLETCTLALRFNHNYESLSIIWDLKLSKSDTQETSTIFKLKPNEVLETC